jgi:WD40 repeat protein
MFVLAHSEDAVDALAFAPVGPLLAVGHNYRRLCVWNLSETRLISDQPCGDAYIRAEFRFHPTLPHLYYTSDFGEVYWFDPVTRDVDTLCTQTGWAENLVLTRDANRLLVCERGYCEFRLFDLTRGYDVRPVWTAAVYSRATWGTRVSVELLPDEERFVVVENHGNTRTRVAVRSLETGELLAASRIPNRTASGFALSPDGTCAVVASESSLFVYQTEKLKVAPRKVRNDNRKHFTGIAFHPSGKYLAATSNDATVKLFDTTTWDVARTFTWDVGKMRSTAFSPDGTLAAAGSDTGKVVVWDVDL